MPVPSPSEFQKILRAINAIIHSKAKSNHELFSRQLLGVIKQKDERDKSGVFPFNSTYWQNLLAALPEDVNLQEVCDYFVSALKFNSMRVITEEQTKGQPELSARLAQAIAVIETTKRGECQEMSFMAMYLLVEHAVKEKNLDLVQYNLHHICFTHKDYAETRLSHGFLIIGEIKDQRIFESLSYEKLLSFADNFIIWDPFKNVSFTIAELKTQPEDSEFKKYLRSLELDQHGKGSTAMTFATRDLDYLASSLKECESLAKEYKKLEQQVNAKLIACVHDIYNVLQLLEEKPGLAKYHTTIKQLQANFIQQFRGLGELPRPVLTVDPRTEEPRLRENKNKLETVVIELNTWLKNNPGREMDPELLTAKMTDNCALIHFKTEDREYNLLISNYFYAMGSLMHRGKAFNEALSMTQQCLMLRVQYHDKPERITIAEKKIAAIEAELAKIDTTTRPALAGS